VDMKRIDLMKSSLDQAHSVAGSAFSREAFSLARTLRLGMTLEYRVTAGRPSVP
jgi:hypothetical protein